MPTYVWLLIWGVAIATLAFFYVRERRSGRKPIAEVDRYGHQATREAGACLDGGGPNSGAQTWLG